MADIKFSALPNMSALAGTESLVGLQSGAASLGTPAQINTYVRSTMGTGVSTALSVNVGTAGSFVVNGGALGTPSSGTLTNCTGLPAAGVVGTAAILGANTFTGAQIMSSTLDVTGRITGTAAVWSNNGAMRMDNGISIGGQLQVNWYTGGAFAAIQVGLNSPATDILEIDDGSLGNYRDLKLRNVVGQIGYHEMVEMTAPVGGAANTVRIYAEDNGAGKTRLMAIFNTGAAQQIAIQP